MKRGQKVILKFILIFIKVFFALLVLDIIGIGLISLLRYMAIKKSSKKYQEKKDDV